MSRRDELDGVLRVGTMVCRAFGMSEQRMDIGMILRGFEQLGHNLR